MKNRHWPHYIVLIAVGFVLLLPIVATLIFSFTTGWVGLLPNGWSLNAWKTLIFDKPDFWMSVVRSFVISVFPIFISLICMIMAMYVAILYVPKLDSVLQSISMIPYTLRGVVLAISVLSLFAGKGTIFSNRIVMLVCVYCVVILPFIYRGLRNNLYAINVQQLLEAAELLGAGGLYTFLRIIVPNMLSGLLVSALLALGSIFTDYAVIKIIAGSRYITAQAELYEINYTVGGPLASAVIIVMFALTFLIAVISYGIQNRGKNKMK